MVDSLTNQFFGPHLTPKHKEKSTEAYITNQCMKIPISHGKYKKKPSESDMLIGAIGLLLLIVVLCGYQIYQFLTGLK